jgi:hypothetical protein
VAGSLEKFGQRASRHGRRHGAHRHRFNTLETDMSKTSHESQDTPLPADDESVLANSEAEQESSLAMTPAPDTATRPSIKNN